MKNCCKKIIKKLDIFGILVTFHINNDIKYRTIYGGIFTIIFFFFSLGFTIYLGYIFITRKNINFIYSNKIVEKRPYINLTKANFKFGFGIQYQDTALCAIDDFKKYFHYSIILKEWINKDIIIESPFGLKKCDYSDFLNIDNEQFDMNHIDEMFCPILNNSINFTLEGLFTDNYSKFIQMEIKFTEYGMNNFEEIIKRMEDNPIEMVIYFLDSGIDYQNRTNPLPLYINYINRGLDEYFEKTTEIFLSTIEFNNDESLLFNKENKTIDGMFDKSEDSFHFTFYENKSKKNGIGKFFLKVSSKSVILERNYQKFPSFIGQLSGIIEQTFIIILFIMTLIEREDIDNKLIQKMFKMKGSKNYDVNYFLNLFHRDKFNNYIMNLIKIGNLEIDKNFNLNSNDNLKLILNNHSNSNLIPQKNILENQNKFQFSLKYSSCNQQNEKNNIKLINFSHPINLKKTNKNDIKNSEDNFVYDKKSLSNCQLESNYISLQSKNIKDNKIKAEIDFASIDMFSIFYSYICFCLTKYRKRKYELIKKAKNKINYYLEISNYIKGMQEIDLFKYCLFNKDQIIILDYLSKPPFKTNNIKDTYIYEEFENKQVNFEKIGKKEINEIYNSYDKIRNKENISFEDFKLIRLLNAESDYLF